MSIEAQDINLIVLRRDVHGHYYCNIPSVLQEGLQCSVPSLGPEAWGTCLQDWLWGDWGGRLPADLKASLGVKASASPARTIKSMPSLG